MTLYFVKPEAAPVCPLVERVSRFRLKYQHKLLEIDKVLLGTYWLSNRMMEENGAILLSCPIRLAQFPIFHFRQYCLLLPRPSEVCHLVAASVTLFTRRRAVGLKEFVRASKTNIL
jgi:hypothetical protein